MFTIRIDVKEKTRELDIEQNVASESSVIVCLCVLEYVWFFSIQFHIYTQFMMLNIYVLVHIAIPVEHVKVFCDVCARFDATLVICWRKREGYDDLKIKLKHQWYCLTYLSLPLPFSSSSNFYHCVCGWHIKLVINFHSKSRSNIQQMFWGEALKHNHAIKCIETVIDWMSSDASLKKKASNQFYIYFKCAHWATTLWFI